MAEAIFIVEYKRIPLGIAALDVMVKRSPVSVFYSNPVCIGRYMIALGGDVEDVREARAAVTEQGREQIASEYLLTNAHSKILAYLNRTASRVREPSGRFAVGIFETRSAASGFTSLDAALKNGSVDIGKIWFGHYLGGKLCFVITGLVADVESALKAAANAIDPKDYSSETLIPSPDEKTMRRLLDGFGENNAKG